MNKLNIDFDKQAGLIPTIIQDNETRQVLMLGYMNQGALKKTQETGFVTFFSRSRQKLWTKGETSGNYLSVVDIQSDCDNDTLLILAKPQGPTCHTGNYSCFGKSRRGALAFLPQLQNLIDQRKKEMPEGSYTTKLFNKGIDKIAQKVGEEAVETIIEAKNTDDNLLLNESADLIYHLIVLLSARNLSIEDVEKVLMERSR